MIRRDWLVSVLAILGLGKIFPALLDRPGLWGTVTQHGEFWKRTPRVTVDPASEGYAPAEPSLYVYDYDPWRKMVWVSFRPPT